MLGDYWRGREEPIASGAVVALLGEFRVSPQNSRAKLSRLRETRRALDELGVQRATVFRASVVYGQGASDPLSAWDLRGLRSKYEEFIRRAGQVLAEVSPDAVGPGEALVLRTELMDVWR